MRLATKAVHIGQETDPQTYAIVPPVYFTSTYFQKGLGHTKGYDYSRASHPNREMLEQALASMEGAKFGACFASGCAATTAMLSCLEPGDHVLASDDLYGGTYRLFMDVFRKWGLSFTYVKSNASLAAIKKLIRPRTKLIWIETPTNPMLKIFDIRRFVEAKGKRKIWVLVDNTFATSMLQQPLALGADIVLHSCTKYIGGHSDLIGGALVLNDEELKEQIRFHQKAQGATPGPMDCYLTHRGLKTLAVRMRAHCENTEYLVEWLKEQPQIGKLYYPGLDAKALDVNDMKAGGGMVSFELKKGDFAPFLKRLKVIRLAESLGGVESLICYPYTMTHGSVPDAQKEKIGITKKLLRLSVGIEDWSDLIDDLKQALKGL